MGVTTTTASAATYVPIATLTGAGSSTLSFTSIPSTYTDLVVIANLFGSNDGVNTLINVNGNNSGYSDTWLAGSGSSATSGRDTASSAWVASHGPLGSGSTTAPFFMELHFQNYSNTTTYKTMLGRMNILGATYNGTVAGVHLWANTSAINQITFTLQSSATYTGNATATLYGVKAA